MKPLLVSSGEPAGIGPDLCIALAESNLPVVVLGDYDLLKNRAKLLKKNIQFSLYNKNKPIEHAPGSLTILPISCKVPVSCGQLDPNNAAYVIELLTLGAQLCADKEFSALITAPVHKSNINAAGIAFSGHTEFFAEYFNVETVVMMLACEQMKVALLTTHLPLNKVSAAITYSLIIKIINQLHTSLVTQFAISNPYIKVAGLNPHAGESGYLGREEVEIITPALDYLRKQGMNLEGPLPADTMFVKENSEHCDAYLAMYHDQGLPVLKYAGFNQAVNITLGLPIIRTSVDHGTALELAGKGEAHTGSIFAAASMAMDLAVKGNTNDYH